MKKEALRVSTTVPAAPTTVYLAWLSAEQHSAMTGGAAKIDTEVGGKFSTWNGFITGKLVILDLGRRLLMSWRTTDFPRDAADSRVEIFFEALGGSTRITALHTEIPEGLGEATRAIWNDKYFSPMRTFFSSYLPDPRNPPPPRRPQPPPDEDDEEEIEDEAPKKGKFSKSPVPGKKDFSRAAPSKKEVAPSAGVASKSASSGKGSLASAPAGKSPTAKAPAEKAPVSKAPAAKAPTSKAPAAKAPASKAPAAKASSKTAGKASSSKAPAAKSPSKTAGKAPTAKTPSKAQPAKGATAKAPAKSKAPAKPAAKPAKAKKR